MARKLTGKPTGRPQKDIDWTLFEQLCGIQCTQSEIASMMKVDVDTLRDRVVKHFGEEYSAIYKKYCENGKCSLRRNQFVLSKTNASLAIWLGKQWLGQRDEDPNRGLSPNDAIITMLLADIKSLKDKVNATQPKANPEF